MDQVPRTLQKIMSAEATPLLSGVLPAMERFVTRWEQMQDTYPAMSGIIEVGLEKIVEYYNKSYKQRAYPIAMGEWTPFYACSISDLAWLDLWNRVQCLILRKS